MFFNEEELRVAEEMAWKMLDGLNHAYMPDLKDYARKVLQLLYPDKIPFNYQKLVNRINGKYVYVRMIGFGD